MKPSPGALVVAGLTAASAALSFIHPWGNLRSGGSADTPLLAGSSVPSEVRHVFEMKCADCHSINTRWPAYSRLAPGSWLMEKDVHEARQHLDLSHWQSYDMATQIELLAKIGSEARNGEMPLKHYLILHPNARLTPEEQRQIYDWTRLERKLLKKQQADQTDKTSPKEIAQQP
jgi:cytochrome c